MSIKRFTDFAPITGANLIGGHLLVGYRTNGSGVPLEEIRTTVQSVADFVSNGNNHIVPPGVIVPYAIKVDIQPGDQTLTKGTLPPDGWLLCNGANASIEKYKSLYNAIGNTFGKSQDPKTYFVLPDLRGLFIRGYGGKSSTFGQMQQDSYKEHAHSIDISDTTTVTVTPNNKGSYRGVFVSTSRRPATPVTDSIDGVAAGVNYIDAGASSINRGTISASTTSKGTVKNSGNPDETRPMNMALSYIIKY